MSDEPTGTRINKYLSELGLCSRREADMWIELGRVSINGKIPTAGTRITRRDKVRVDGRVVSEPQEDAVYLAFNKPPGVVSTTDPSEPDNIVDYVNYPKRVFPIGRLDKPSEGLIFMTSDGDIVNKILRAGNEHEKEYEVTVDRLVTPDFIEKMSGGVPIMGTMTKKCKVEMITPHSFRIILIQGLNRQIRRMCEYFEYDVKKLKRTRIMNVKLDLPSGQWRELTSEELSEIQRLTQNSSKKTEKKQSTQGQKSKAKSKTKPQPSNKTFTQGRPKKFGNKNSSPSKSGGQHKTGGRRKKR